MTDLLQSIGEKIKGFGESWASYSIAGSLALYLLGYLALRFHLTALGVGTDMEVLDERYLFAGARCLVYLVSASATVVFLGLLLAIPLYVAYGLLAVVSSGRAASWIARGWHWATAPTRLALAGLLFSSALIQLVMKDCFLFGNLLLREKLPDDSALSGWLVHASQSRLNLYFYGLVGAAILSGAILIATRTDTQEKMAPPWVRHLFGFMVAVQWLLLPINYGYLVMDKQLPAVASLDGATPLPSGREAWLAWENKDNLTFLVFNETRNLAKRSLLTVPRDQVKTIEITGYKPIFQTLFGQPQRVLNNEQKQ